MASISQMPSGLPLSNKQLKFFTAQGKGLAGDAYLIFLNILDKRKAEKKISGQTYRRRKRQYNLQNRAFIRAKILDQESFTTFMAEVRAYIWAAIDAGQSEVEISPL